MPTVASSGASIFSSTAATLTASITVASGDLLVILAIIENGASPVTTAPTNTGTALTFTQRAAPGTDLNHARAIMFTADSSSSQTTTVTVTRPAASNKWGFQWWVINNHNGVGAVASASTGSNTQAITTTASNSMLIGGSGDWNAVDGASRTRRTINSSTGTEYTYFRDSVAYTVYTQSYADAGIAGSVTFGYSAPTGQLSAIIALEIKAAAGVTTVTKSLAQTWNVNALVVKSIAETWNINALVVKSLAETWLIRQQITKSLAQNWIINTFVVKSLAETWGIGGIITKSLPETWNISATVTKSLAQTWLISINVTKMLQVTWPINAYVIKSINQQWNVNTFVTKSLNETWDVISLSTVTKSLSESWNIQISVIKSLTESWSLSAFVLKNLAVDWQVNSANLVIVKSIDFIWEVDSYVTGSVADQEFQRLTGLGYTGTVSEMRRKFFLDNVVVVDEDKLSLNDLEFLYLRSIGLTGSLADMREQNSNIDW
jgi:hypothetical protein